MSTARLEVVTKDAKQDIPMQPASLDIWDKKYRLKPKAGEALDADIDGTYQRVAKALADSLDLSLSDLVEGVLLHALEGQAPFSDATLARAGQLKQVFGLDLGARHAHRLTERPAPGAARRRR